MLGKIVVLSFVVMIAFDAVIAQKPNAVAGISFVTMEEFDANTVNENADWVLMHRGKPNLHGIIRYTIGARSSADRLVASGSQNNAWPTAHNAAVQLHYPQQGVGATVTYVEASVNQTSNLGRAYVISGGINQHSISVVVEAYDTLLFNIVASIYGI